MPRWGMVINLHTCIGCYNCQVSCKQENFVPMGIFFNRLLVGESGSFPSVRKLVFPVLCNHCQEPPCVDVCPSGATKQRSDGIVYVDADKCIGCRSCLIACPYQQRSFLASKTAGHFPQQGPTPYEEVGGSLRPYKPGTVVKCDFCKSVLEDAAKQGLNPAADHDAQPACVRACPVKARHFGDLDDPGSEVSRMIRDNKAVPLHPEYGTKPSVYYITTG